MSSRGQVLDEVVCGPDVWRDQDSTQKQTEQSEEMGIAHLSERITVAVYPQIQMCKLVASPKNSGSCFLRSEHSV